MSVEIRQGMIDDILKELEEKAFVTDDYGRNTAFHMMLIARSLVASYETPDSSNYRAITDLINRQIADDKKLLREREIALKERAGEGACLQTTN